MNEDNNTNDLDDRLEEAVRNIRALGPGSKGKIAEDELPFGIAAVAVAAAATPNAVEPLKDRPKREQSPRENADKKAQSLATGSETYPRPSLPSDYALISNDRAVTGCPVESSGKSPEHFGHGIYGRVNRLDPASISEWRAGSVSNPCQGAATCISIEA